MKYDVTRFKSLNVALRELEQFIRDAEQLQTGRPLAKFGGMLPRELLGNWLLCVAVNSVTHPDRLTFTSQPLDRDGDGIIVDTVTGDTVSMEHVLVPRQAGGPDADIEALILGQIEKK